jgi:hypothetical protein
MSRTRMPRAAVAWVGLLLSLAVAIAGCGQPLDGHRSEQPTTSVVVGTEASSRPSSTTTPVTFPEATSSTNPALASGQTYEAVILGPGAEPVASDDVAPRLFRDEPSVRGVLEAALPAGFAQREGQYAQGTHLIVVLNIAGAAETPTGVEVYADAWEQWFSLTGWKPVQGSAGAFPMRIRLAREADAFRLDGVDVPEDGEGYARSLDEMMPSWVRARDDNPETRDRLKEALLVAAADWARPNVPADLFVDQTPAAIPDPHGHQPPSSEFRMLAPRYVDCSLTKISPPSSADYQPELAYASEDGRFQLYFLLTSNGVVVKDARTGAWWSVEAPGQPSMAVMGAVSFDPEWRGHTLFTDFKTFMDPFQPTLTHYEIDFDSMTVVRAVPMGPLSFNETVR